MKQIMRYTMLLLMSLGTCFAKPLSPDQIAHIDFWNPTFNIQRLNYCLIDGHTCGLKVAQCFCKLMGYPDASEAQIDYNVGYTNYLNTSASCKGWKCNGFRVIRCVNTIIHKPVAPYYYRLKRFALPRFAHYRVDWCLKKNQRCGRPAANSFCKRLGYMHVRSFKQQVSVPATKTLGSQELCFGKQCRGFSEITCYR